MAGDLRRELEAQVSADRLDRIRDQRPVRGETTGAEWRHAQSAQQRYDFGCRVYLIFINQEKRIL